MLKPTATIFAELKATHPAVQAGLMEQAVFKVWQQILPDSLKHVHFDLAFRGGTLIVSAGASGYVHEVTARRIQLLRKLNERMEGETVKKIRVVLSHSDVYARGETAVSEVEGQSPEGAKRERPSRAQTASFDSLKERLAHILGEEEMSREEKVQLGWGACPSCKTLHPGGVKVGCRTCLKAGDLAEDHRVEQVFSAHPWLSYLALKQEFPKLVGATFERIFRRVEARWKNKLLEMARFDQTVQGAGENAPPHFWQTAYLLASLWTGKPPRELGREKTRALLLSRLPKIFKRTKRL